MIAPFASDITIIRSPGAVLSAPQLSVLVPYYHDNPSELMADLLAQSDADIEVLFYDDGTNDKTLNSRLEAEVALKAEAMTLIIAEKNRGRSAARNALQNAARGDWVLFLDADMRPVSSNFLAQYKTTIAADNCDIIFGGFTVPERAEKPEQDLHRALSHVSDCLPLAQRKAAGAQFVASSNLCVRKSVLAAETFDPGFTGWGWEDSEWAARAAARFTLIHIDNPALHLLSLIHI